MTTLKQDLPSLSWKNVFLEQADSSTEVMIMAFELALYSWKATAWPVTPQPLPQL